MMYVSKVSQSIYMFNLSTGAMKRLFLKYMFMVPLILDTLRHSHSGRSPVYDMI